MSDADALHGQAVSLLRALSGPDGIRASQSRTTNYEAVFARDAVMAGIAGLLLDDRAIISALTSTLERLRELQGGAGQIASNYRAVNGETQVSFGTLAPRIDSATWYVIGVAIAARAGTLDPRPFRDSIRAVVRLLDGLEYNGRHLIYIPPGGNWADEYVYEGYILYDQVLRAWALRLAGGVFVEPSWTEKAAAIEQTIESRFWPHDAERTHPIAAFSPTSSRDIFDLAACSLLAVSGVAPTLASAALAGISNRYLGRSRLPPAFDPVIDESHPDWPALRRYHLHDFRNKPHEFHNGGIWPVWLGWLSLGLGRAGRPTDLERLRQMAAEMLGTPRYDFEEFLHGVTHEPGGVPRMAYSATGVVFLRAAGSERQHQLLEQ